MNWFDWAREYLAQWKAQPVGRPRPVSKGFTPRAQQAIMLAQNQAERLHHNFIGTEHLLLGLVELDKGMAVTVLQKLGVRYEAVCSEVEKAVCRGPAGTVPDSFPYTPRTKKVIQLSEKAAESLNHTYIGTEHLLLGLLEGGEGVAAGVLRQFKIDLEKLRDEILVELSPKFPPDTNQA